MIKQFLIVKFPQGGVVAQQVGQVSVLLSTT